MSFILFIFKFANFLLAVLIGIIFISLSIFCFRYKKTIKRAFLISSFILAIVLPMVFGVFLINIINVYIISFIAAILLFAFVIDLVLLFNIIIKCESVSSSKIKTAPKFSGNSDKLFILPNEKMTA